MAPGGPGSCPDVTKDPLSACAVRALNFRGSESRLFGL